MSIIVCLQQCLTDQSFNICSANSLAFDIQIFAFYFPLHFEQERYSQMCCSTHVMSYERLQKFVCNMPHLLCLLKYTGIKRFGGNCCTLFLSTKSEISCIFLLYLNNNSLFYITFASSTFFFTLQFHLLLIIEKKVLNKKMKETTNYKLIINISNENNKSKYKKSRDVTCGYPYTDKPNNSFIIHSDKSLVTVNTETQLRGTKRFHSKTANIKPAQTSIFPQCIFLICIFNNIYLNYSFLSV